MASAEKKAHFRLSAALLALVFMGSAPLPAQDEGATGQPATEEAPDAAAISTVERLFIRSAADTGALAQQYPHLAVWLEPEDAPRVLGLVERETTASPSGAVVILSGEGQSANDGLLAGLRSRLSEAGWATMTLGLEQPSPALEQARERLADVAPPEPRDDADAGDVMIDVNDQAAKELLKAHRDEMGARLTAAVSWFTDQQYRRVALVGVGRGADEVSVFLPKAPDAVSQMAWVAADFGGRPVTEISDAIPANKTVAVLDLHSSRSDRARPRVAAFRRAGVKGYESMAAPVPERPGQRDAGVLANRLVGWLGQKGAARY